ncbi:MAG: AAA family ATPase [Bacilli bacterium]|nr:AAA family ATPase [Bacilli bacterium]
MALNKAKVITVTSVKGGTGKTTTVLNLAGVLANLNKKVVILDLDLYSGSVAASLNLDKGSDIFTMCEDMMNNRFQTFDKYVAPYNEYIDVIASPLDPRNVNKIKANYIEIILSRLILKYEYIIIDTNHIIDNLNLVVLDQSDTVLYTITNDLMDLKNMKTMVSIFKDMQLNNFKIILNEARLNNTSYSKEDVKSLIGAPVDYVLPKNFYNKNIEKFVFEGKIMILDKSIASSKGGSTLEKIIKDIIKE